MSDGKRRAESDGRLEYIYSFLSDEVGISRQDLPTHIHDAALVSKVITSKRIKSKN